MMSFSPPVSYTHLDVYKRQAKKRKRTSKASIEKDEAVIPSSFRTTSFATPDFGLNDER